LIGYARRLLERKFIVIISSGDIGDILRISYDSHLVILTSTYAVQHYAVCTQESNGWPKNTADFKRYSSDIFDTE
jgi:hypothetical protein